MHFLTGGNGEKRVLQKLFKGRPAPKQRNEPDPEFLIGRVLGNYQRLIGTWNRFICIHDLISNLISEEIVPCSCDHGAMKSK